MNVQAVLFDVDFTLAKPGPDLGISNTNREIDDFVVHHRLEVDCAVTSRLDGRTKPHESIFRVH